MVAKITQSQLVVFCLMSLRQSLLKEAVYLVSSLKEFHSTRSALWLHGFVFCLGKTTQDTNWST